MSVTEANDYVSEYHRHHKPVKGAKFAFGCEVKKTGKLVGVAIVGRPVSRLQDDGRTLEVVRVATDGTPNAASFLLARARRIAFDMGADRVLTYILQDEKGTSLKAAGFHLDSSSAGGGSWGWSRPRKDKAPTSLKKRWISDEHIN